MIKLTQLFKTSQQQKSSHGFTLTELLLATSLTSIVIGSSFFGLIAMARGNQTSRIDSLMSNTVNRAAEFISDEIRVVRKVLPNVETVATTTANFDLPAGATPVLALELSPGLNIIYYTMAAENPMLGPNVIYRWGPNLDENGQYDEATLDDTSTWQTVALIDLIDAEAVGAGDIDTLCPTGWQLTNEEPLQGFYACVKPGDRLAQFHIETIADHTIDKDLSYDVTTQAFARTGSSSGGVGSGGVGSGGGGSDTPPELTFEVLGSEITCGAKGAPVSVINTLIITHRDGSQERHTLSMNSPLAIPLLPPGSTIDIEAKAVGGSDRKDFCKNFSSEAKLSVQSNTVKLLKNGDNVPDIKPFANQNTVAHYLSRFIEDGKIVLPENQALILFELGTSKVKNSSFDLQDSVILATINNPSGLPVSNP